MNDYRKEAKFYLRCSNGVSRGDTRYLADIKAIARHSEFPLLRQRAESLLSKFKRGEQCQPTSSAG